MKYTTILILTALIVSGFSNPKPQGVKYGSHAQATPANDTLYLLKGDTLSILTYKVWESTRGPKPCIRFVNRSEMVTIKKRISYDKKK